MRLGHYAAILLLSMLPLRALAIEPDPTSRNPYHCIGATPGMSFNDLKKAYRRAARLFHPDRVQGSGQEKLYEDYLKNIVGAWQEIQRLHQHEAVSADPNIHAAIDRARKHKKPLLYLKDVFRAYQQFHSDKNRMQFLFVLEVLALPDHDLLTRRIREHFFLNFIIPLIQLGTFDESMHAMIDLYPSLNAFTSVLCAFAQTKSEKMKYAPVAEFILSMSKNHPVISVSMVKLLEKFNEEWPAVVFFESGHQLKRIKEKWRYTEAGVRASESFQRLLNRINLSENQFLEMRHDDFCEDSLTLKRK